jgi:hypothetical protein
MTRRRNKPGEHRKPLPDIIRARLVNTNSFYFSNIHDDTKHHEVWKAFGCCGKVKDVFIPSKRNKEGKRFGFVRFANEGDVEDLLPKLEEVWIRSLKLKVNISRFERDLVEVTPEVMAGPVRVHSSTAGPRVVEGVSFAETGQHYSIEVRPEVTCDLPSGRLDELAESVVGLLLPKLSVQHIREQLIIAGMPSIHVASMGGNQVLISSPIKGFLRDSLLERSDWWLSWFQGFTKWSVELPYPGRCA